LAVAVVNDAANQPVYDELQKKFEEYISLNPEEQQTVFDTGYTFNNYDYQSWQKFSMYNMVGDLDVSILPMTYFEEYAPGEYFSPVAMHLSSSLYGALSEYLLETQKTDDKGNLIPGSETVYGIDLSSTWLYQNLQKQTVHHILLMGKLLSHFSAKLSDKRQNACIFVAVYSTFKKSLGHFKIKEDYVAFFLVVFIVGHARANKMNGSLFIGCDLISLRKCSLAADVIRKLAKIVSMVLLIKRAFMVHVPYLLETDAHNIASFFCIIHPFKGKFKCNYDHF
jgi:hypothetical protein